MWDKNYALAELPDYDENEEELDFIDSVLELKDDSVILDLCCGEGRHARGLAESGYKVIGLDLSSELLNIAKQSSDIDNLWFINGDMRYIPLKKNSCHAVINMFTSFGFFDDEGNLDVLKSVSSVLKRKGKFLLDYWNPYASAQLDNTKNWWWVNEKVLVLAHAKFDFLTGRMQDTRIVIDFKNGTMRDSVRDIRFYTLPELEKMLKLADMKILDTFGDIDEREYESKSRRLIVLSEKSK